MKICFSCGSAFESAGWMCTACGASPAVKNGFPVFSPETHDADKGFDAAYFTQLADIEECSFWFRTRNRLILWSLRRYFSGAAKMLEVGCGTGFVLRGIRRAFPHLELSGSDMYAEGLAYAQKRVPGARLFQMDARRMPFKEEFDAIGAFDVIEHIQEDEEILSQMFQSVKKGGGILLTVPQHRYLWSAVDDYSFHKRRYARAELSDKVAHAGFRVVFATSFLFFLLPFLALSRLMQRSQAKSFDPLKEYKTGRFLDAVMEKILNAERSFIERGVSFPAGSSLLLVAKKI